MRLCPLQPFIYAVLQGNRNMKSTLSVRSLLNPGVGSELTINLAGAVGGRGGKPNKLL